MLEPPATLFDIAGYYVLVSAPELQDTKLSYTRAALAGFFFDLGILTKDMTFLVSAVTLLVLFAAGWSMPRRSTLVALAVTGLTYLPYPLVTLALGQWPRCIDAKVTGVRRLLGFLQRTGFNHPGAPSFGSTLAAHLGLYGATYAIIAFGVVGLAVLLSLRDARSRIVAVWAGCAYSYFGFAIKHGTSEPQFFYLLVVPALLATSCAIGNLPILMTIYGRRHIYASCSRGILAACSCPLCAASASPGRRRHLHN